MEVGQERTVLLLSARYASGMAHSWKVFTELPGRLVVTTINRCMDKYNFREPKKEDKTLRTLTGTNRKTTANHFLNPHNASFVRFPLFGVY